MSSVGPLSTSGREKEGKKERTIVVVNESVHPESHNNSIRLVNFVTSKNHIVKSTNLPVKFTNIL